MCMEYTQFRIHCHWKIRVQGKSGCEILVAYVDAEQGYLSLFPCLERFVGLRRSSTCSIQLSLVEQLKPWHQDREQGVVVDRVLKCLPYW